MVFTTAVNFVRVPKPDEFWRKRKIFKLAAVSSYRAKYILCYTLQIDVTEYILGIIVMLLLLM